MSPESIQSPTLIRLLTRVKPGNTRGLVLNIQARRPQVRNHALLQVLVALKTK